MVEKTHIDGKAWQLALSDGFQGIILFKEAEKTKNSYIE